MNVKTLIAWIIIVCSLTVYGCTELIANDKIFNKCKACQGFEKNKRGPHLKGLLTEDGLSGRRIGSVEGYRYSKAMKEWYEEGWKWDEVSLAIWLQNPRKMIPRTKMIFAGIKNEDELNEIIEYLKTK